MEKVKDKIILSMLSELGLGENAYVGNNPAVLVHPLRKLFRGLDVEIEEKSSDGVAFNVGKKVKLIYTKAGTSIKSVTIVG